MTTHETKEDNEKESQKSPVIRLRLQDIAMIIGAFAGLSGGTMGIIGHSDARVDIVKIQDRLTVIEEHMNTQAQGLIKGMEMIHQGQLEDKEQKIQYENLTKIVNELNQKIERHMDRTEIPDKRWPPK